MWTPKEDPEIYTSHYNHLFPYKVPETNIGEKTTSSTNNASKTESP